MKMKIILLSILSSFTLFGIFCQGSVTPLDLFFSEVEKRIIDEEGLKEFKNASNDSVIIYFENISNEFMEVYTDSFYNKKVNDFLNKNEIYLDTEIGPRILIYAFQSKLNNNYIDLKKIEHQIQIMLDLNTDRKKQGKNKT